MDEKKNATQKRRGWFVIVAWLVISWKIQLDCTLSQEKQTGMSAAGSAPQGPKRKNFTDLEKAAVIRHLLVVPPGD